MLQLLQVLLDEFRNKLKSIDTYIPRSFAFPELENKINVAIGMRRVGKTVCMLQKVHKLLTKNNINIEQILYLNLEDDRLIPCSAEQLAELIEAFYSLYPNNHERRCYIFLDEIQNVLEWPVLIRRIFDSKNVQIFLSGSSAKLLSKEIHTSLRGRALSTSVWPYSFEEYLVANNITFNDDLYGAKNKDLLMHTLKQYLHTGGFPEILQVPIDRRQQLLQDYVNVVIMRDIIERHSITNITLIKYMIKSLLKNSGNPFAVNKFYNDIKTQGLSAAKNTLYDYLEYIEDTYLILAVPLYSESVRKTQTNPRKVYAIDPGISRAYSFGINQNFGHLFETLFYLELRRRNYQVYYYLTSERYEVDFLAITPNNEIKLYQVVWDNSDPKTIEREQRALTCAERELNIRGELITAQNYLEMIWNRHSVKS